MTFVFSDLAAKLKAHTPLTAGDLAPVRAWMWENGTISPEEAETLFALDRAGGSAAPEWVDAFVEAIVEHVVNQLPPKGYVDDGNAEWLIAQLKRGAVSFAQLSALVKVIERALNAPPALKAFALEQVERAVVTGAGPTRDGGALRPGVVDAAEVAFLRRLIFAPGGDGALMVSRAEAELLGRIKDATRGGANAPGWRELFVQGVGNYILSATDYDPLERDEAVRLERFMDDTRINVPGFILRVFGALFRGDVALPGDDTGPPRRAHLEEGQVTAAEDAWLTGQVEADGEIDEDERALLAFVAAERRARPAAA